jgi:hypothetical protein
MSISHYKVVVVTCMKITKTNDKRIGLNLNSKHKTKGSKQEHEMCENKVQTNIYYNEINKFKHKRNRTRLYLKLMLNILKIMGGLTFIIPFQGSFLT